MKEWIGSALLALVLVGLVFGLGHLAGRASLLGEYGELAGKVEQQNTEAAKRLKDLTEQRDEKQAKLDQQARDQEKKDADAKTEIDRLAGELESRPVLVRIVTTTAPGGRCSGSAAGEAASSAEDRPGDAGSASGLLPPENTRRLNAALSEVETLSAAYNSCRARLLPVAE